MGSQRAGMQAAGCAMWPQRLPTQIAKATGQGGQPCKPTIFPQSKRPDEVTMTTMVLPTRQDVQRNSCLSLALEPKTAEAGGRGGSRMSKQRARYPPYNWGEPGKIRGLCIFGRVGGRDGDHICGWWYVVLDPPFVHVDPSPAPRPPSPCCRQNWVLPGRGARTHPGTAEAGGRGDKTGAHALAQANKNRP